MLSIIPIDKCKSPVRLRSYDGTISSYPCGRCSHCLNSRQSRWRRKLEFELNTEGVFALFITLTYSNDHLPLIEYDDNKKLTKFTRTKFDRHGRFIRINETEKFSEVYPDFESYFLGSDWNYPHFTASRINGKCILDVSNRFAISYLPDVQDFVKRLRTNLFRSDDLQDEDVAFKYFICSEYGPQTFRPHYHGILFFRSEKVRKYAHDGLILKSWNKCSIDRHQSSQTCEYVNKNKGIASYVSKYITSTSDLPICFSARFSRPFYTFSKATPIGSEFISLYDAKDLLEAKDLLFHTKFHNKQQNSFEPIDYPYPDSLWNRIFPRFSFQSRLSPNLLFEVFKHLYFYSQQSLRRAEPFRSLSEEYIPEYPNYIDYIKKKYFINPRPRDYSGDPRDINFNSYASIFHSLCSECSFLDLFCFGIPQNRSASLKVIRNFCSGLFSTPFDYYSSFNNYHLVKYNTSFSQFVDYCSVYSQEELMSPSMILFLYRNLADNLPDSLDCFDPSDRDKYDRILQSGFDLTLDDFYCDGKLIEPYFDNFAWEQYSDHIDHSFRKHKTARLYNFNKYDDL